MINFPFLKSSSLGMKCSLQKILEKSCMILVHNIGIPAYSKITAHIFVKVKFLDYTCDMWGSKVDMVSGVIQMLICKTRKS
jgi:hypothetical protein